MTGGMVLPEGSGNIPGSAGEKYHGGLPGHNFYFVTSQLVKCIAHQKGINSRTLLKVF